MPSNRATPAGLVRRVAWVAAPFAGGALATCIAFLLLRDSFTDDVARHFSLDGPADDYSSPGTALGLYMVVFATETVGVIAAGFSSGSALTTTRSLGVFSIGLAAATAYVLVAVMWTTSGSDGHIAQPPLFQVAVGVVVGAVAGAAAWLVSRRPT
ncbi:hypothetical protein [Streptomyces sp. JV184]|uniref:hypothetical protein n=1 Tax=Streptomyces sp. JV184 TaxID=858637 RepID=UPI002E7A8144|nr:hypothetical protein [Streptomyces sp. JV184]MEE1748726.1 hypothetical protein [Streptomyces sp. JV184]